MTERYPDKNSPIPIYYQLQQILLEKIDRGDWIPGIQLPSERELAEKYVVSRMTMRNALAALSRSGILDRKIGRGTFVAERRITQALNNLTSFSAEMSSRGLKAGARLISLRVERAGVETASQMGIAGDQPVVRVERLRLAEDQPMAIERVTLHFPGCAHLLEDDLTGSLYLLLTEKYSVTPRRAHQQIRAGFCEKKDSQLLALQPKSPVLFLTRLTYSQDDVLFEYAESVYRGDKYIFDIQLNLGTPTLSLGMVGEPALGNRAFR